MYGRKTVSVGETVDNHDGFVMWMINARGLNDETRFRWDADMMCSAGQRRPMRWEPWLLLDVSAFAFSLSAFAGAGGCDLACLHELANV